MALAAGTRLGPYEIVAALGAGGMGEVYQARDTRLDRTVAIKVLPAELSSDPERRARFEREARTIAALNHPHICTLHDIGQHDGATYLVMEHLAGETLAQRLRKGPLPIAQALDLGAQVAEALDAAHKAGIVHRDLKPSNVMLTANGAKLLDFGLAKLRASEAGVAVNTSAPTAIASLTQAGEVLGTRPYMAPEQAEGKATDARTDLWALGCVLYEMVTGRAAFSGDTVASITAAILAREPEPLVARQPLTPPALEHVVRKCLAKIPDARWQSAADLADELRWINTQHGPSASPAVSARQRRIQRMALAAAGVCVLALAGMMAIWLTRSAAPLAGPVARLTLQVNPAEELNTGGYPTVFLPTPGGSRTAFTWTPDGQGLVFVGRQGGVQRLYLRKLDASEAQPLRNTEGAQMPAVSGDGRWVAFWADGALKKAALDGGPAMDLVPGLAFPPRGLGWDGEGGVFYARAGDAIWHVSAGGQTRAVTRLGDAEKEHVLPHAIADREVLLYTVRRRESSWGDEEVVAQRLAASERKVVLRDAADARYLPTGHLLFMRRGALFGVPFDADRLEVRGAPVALVDGVAQALTSGHTNNVTGAGQFAVSSTGTLAWVPGPVGPLLESALVAVDRRGRVSPLPAPVRSYGTGPSLSPDSRHLAVTILTLTETSLWTYDLERGALTPLLREGEVAWPTWWPDGRRLAFSWLHDGRWSVAAQAADMTAPPEVLAILRHPVSSVSKDGRQIAAAFVQQGDDIMVVTPGQGKTVVEPWLRTPDVEMWPVFSPDGQWLAYGSNASGRFEVYVRPYPGPGQATQVSVDGGGSPAWRSDARELYFVSEAEAPGTLKMMAAGFTPQRLPRAGRPQALFAFDSRRLSFDCRPVRCYDVAPDGQRFYVQRSEPVPPPPVVSQITLVQNWFEELKAKVPAGR